MSLNLYLEQFTANCAPHSKFRKKFTEFSELIIFFLQAEFRLKRHLTGYYMCLFVPSMVAVFVSWASLWVAEQPPMRATLNVTPLALLVLQALLVVIRFPQQTCFWSPWWVFYLLCLFCSVLCVFHYIVAYSVARHLMQQQSTQKLDDAESKSPPEDSEPQWFRQIRIAPRLIFPLFWGLLVIIWLLN